MSEEMDLFAYAEQQQQIAEAVPADSIQGKFLEFHHKNPAIFVLILKFIREVKQRGYKQYSINGIFERIRWHVNIETEGDTFKLNNNYRSRYVRMIEEKYPEYVGFFETRTLVADE